MAFDNYRVQEDEERRQEQVADLVDSLQAENERLRRRLDAIKARASLDVAFYRDGNKFWCADFTHGQLMGNLSEIQRLSRED